MGTVTDMETGEVREVPDCDCPDRLQGKVAQGEEVICEHGWSFRMTHAGQYGWVLTWAKEAYPS